METSIWAEIIWNTGDTGSSERSLKRFKSISTAKDGNAVYSFNGWYSGDEQAFRTCVKKVVAEKRKTNPNYTAWQYFYEIGFRPGKTYDPENYLKEPELDVKGPRINGPTLDIKGPKI